MDHGNNILRAISAAASATGLPWWLIYGVIEQESGFDPRAESNCGALGLMQLMPSSFSGYDKAALLDPETNIRLGSTHLQRCIAMWHDEAADEAIKFGIASYNGGPGYILDAQRRCIAAGVDPHVWHNVGAALPSSTCDGKSPDAEQILNYVQAIWAKFAARRNDPLPAGATEAA